MKQYCRYCAFCFEADDYRCSNHPKGEEPHWTEADIKRVNKCKNFIYSDLGDIITGRQYHPRQSNQKKPEPLRYYDGFDFEAENGW